MQSLRIYQLDHQSMISSSQEGAILKLILPSIGVMSSEAVSTDEDVVAAVAAFGHGCYVHVADIDGDDPDFAFRHTQHLDHSWSENPHQGVVPVQGATARSTSVGDLIEVDGTYMLVAGIGFRVMPADFVSAAKRHSS